MNLLNRLKNIPIILVLISTLTLTYQTSAYGIGLSCKNLKKPLQVELVSPTPKLWTKSIGSVANGRNLTVIVGAFSSGTLLPAFAKDTVLTEGAPDFVVNIIDQKDIDPSVARTTEHIDLEIPWSAYQGNLQKIIRILRSLGGDVKVLTPGYEDAVQLAHDIQTKGFPHLPMTSMNPQNSLSKERLGSLTPKNRIDQSFSSVDAFQAWVIEYSKGNSFLPSPLMLKPDGGSASLGNRRVETVEEAVETFSDLMGIELTNMTVNNRTHVSSFIEGVEFVPNLAKLSEGPSSIIKFSSLYTIIKERIDGHPVYKYEVLLDPLHPDVGQHLQILFGEKAAQLDLVKVLTYTSDWSNKVQFLNGPAHPELIWAFAKNGLLQGSGEGLDFAFRLMGGRRPDLVGRASAYSDAYYGYAALRNPSLFKQLPDFNRPHSFAGAVFLSTRFPGIMDKSGPSQLQTLIRMGKIKSRLRVAVEPPGTEIPITKDIHEIPGVIELVLDPNKGSFHDLIKEMELIRSLNWVERAPTRRGKP